MRLIVTCEHAGNEIPKSYKCYFKDSEAILQSHRGLDLGAFDIFKTLESLSDWATYSKTSRLLIELNRSLHHPQLFSEFSKQLSKEEKEKLIRSYYSPYRFTVENAVKSYIDQNETVLHLSVHSFTPKFNGVTRNCDIGLLFDSRLSKEKTIAFSFKEKLKVLQPDLNVRFNYPYLGKADGFTTYLRKKFPRGYLGIELETNQKFVQDNVIAKRVKNTLFNATKQLQNETH